ncbi:MAG TPA: PH domain-containing protein [Blastococcus sp.]|nr:PH domain-containing protein [Blastococcus sp.]
MTGSERKPPRSARARKDIEKYLLPTEGWEIITQRHPAVLIRPTVVFLPVLIVGGWLLTYDPENRFTSSVGLLVIVGAFGYYGLRLAEWWMRHFIVTKRRVLLTSGVLVRTVTLLPLRRITDLTWQETLGGQLFGYGTFRFESAGQDQALRHLTYVPKAQQVYQDISALLFGRDYPGPAAGGDEEGDDEREPLPGGPPAGGRRASDRHDTEPIIGSPPQQT